MAVQLKNVFHGVTLDQTYARIKDGSIVGGKTGWRCELELYASANEAQMVEVARTVAELPNHMRFDPKTGIQLNDTELEQVAAALPKDKVRKGTPYDNVPFPSAQAGRNTGVVPWVEGEDPYTTLYRAIGEAFPSSKAV